MPWHIVQNHTDCPASRPWAVVKDADGEVEGCHPSKAAAESQLAALYANEHALASLGVTLVETFDRDGGLNEERTAVMDMYPMDEGGGDTVTLPDDEDALLCSLLDHFTEAAIEMHAYQMLPGDERSSDVDAWVTSTLTQLMSGINKLHDFKAAAAAAYAAPPQGVAIGMSAGGKPSPGTPADSRLKQNTCPDGQRMLNGKCVPKYLAMALDGEEIVDGGHPIQPWHGTLVVEGSETGDGREFALQSLSWEDPTSSLILLGWQPKDLPQHEEAVTVGRVNHIERTPQPDGSAAIEAWGVIDLGSEYGREVVRQVKGGYAGGLSVDVDSVANVEIVFPEEQPTGESLGEDGPTFIVGQPEKKVFHQGRIRGVTLCRLPALVEGRLELLGEEDALVASSDPIALTRPESDKTLDATAPDNEGDALVSAGAPVTPPAEWFDSPGFKEAVPFTVTDEGRVFGHMALWATCHTTFPNRCITPPREREHAYFLRHELKTREGGSVSVGTITLGVGHAATSLGAVPAAAHYDDPRLAVADVNVGEDKYGIWIAGALRPTVSEEQLSTLSRGVSLSGDWRNIAGKLRLVAVLCVNVPGFPVPRMRVSASTEDGPWETLVAAGVLTDKRVERVNEPHPPNTIVVKRAPVLA